MNKETEVLEHKSSIISKTKFSFEKKELIVEFNNGNSYVYTDFTRENYVDFVNAESQGSHFGTVIRKNHPCTKLEEV